MGKHPREPALQPVPAPLPTVPGLVERAAAQIEPVLRKLCGDRRFRLARDWLTRRGHDASRGPLDYTRLAGDYAREALAYAIGDADRPAGRPYTSAELLAAETTRQFSRDGFEGAERETVNLSDLNEAGLLATDAYRV